MQWTLAILVSLSVVVLVALGLLIGLAASRSQAQAWERVAAARRELWRRESSPKDFGVSLHPGSVMSGQPSETSEDGRKPLDIPDYALSGGAIDRYWAIERRPRRSSLLLKLAEIETEAERVLDDQIGPAHRQVLQIRAELQRLGIWTQDDVAVFDRAMKVRNSIVHGEDARTQESDIDVSDADLTRLLKKLRD